MQDYLGAKIPKLGFGLMRLPEKDGVIDLPQMEKMVDNFLAQGFTYFDTAYVYGDGKSEIAAREALVKRHPRESFQLTDKLPVWMGSTFTDFQKLFDTSLERTGAGYFDFYLMHALNRSRIEKMEEDGTWKFAESLKERGLIKHLGFSFHDTPEVLDALLEEHPEAEFVQLQINYADWENPSVQSRRCYEIAAQKHSKPVIIMEPVKGGALAVMPKKIQQIFKKAEPDMSIPSWAVRYAASLPQVVTVLSGMSNEAQMQDNLSYMKDFKPLDDGERATVKQVADILAQTPTIPCTKCKYCVAGCPQKINIPGVLAALNSNTLYANKDASRGDYEDATENGGRASACLACSACEAQCPQHIKIIEELKKAVELFE